MKKRSLWMHIAVFGAILMALFLLAYYGGFILKDCGTDKKCFQERFSSCLPTELDFVRNNNVYRYELKNVLGSCSLEITLKRIAEGAPSDTKELLNGKSMKCALNENQRAPGNFENVAELMEDCHGELKEGLYELIVRRMYAEVLSRINEVEQEAKKIL